ncbi:60S ribosomal protein L7 [Parelaphostrongylus tenuis]|uniref:60S ribosomal protein L7 n=1 Tax=Parelaphostrongylus tenuis TaxID=148309 RepID=A0AAD5MYR1_PARTN|nr:60S ribosomal protein L7 [Parelaphostrongylus tenuis]
MVEKKLPQVPETVLKRRKLRAEIRAKIHQNKLSALLIFFFQKRKEKRAKIFKRAEKYVTEYRQAQREQLRLRRDAEKNGDFYVPDEPKLAFVIRIRGINQIHPRPRKALQILRLRQINNGVFVKLNKATLPLLRIVETICGMGIP